MFDDLQKLNMSFKISFVFNLVVDININHKCKQSKSSV